MPAAATMRVAALYDIHGNLPALEAVLHDVRDAGVDHVVIGGDVAPGPMARETLACLLELPMPVLFISGNGESAVLAEIDGTPAASLSEQAREAIRWAAHELRPGEERFVRSWPPTVHLDVPGIGAVLFCHATPRNNNEFFTRATADDRLAPAFVDVEAPVVVCGHTHMQFDRTLGATRIVNAGSVGMPFGEPGAYWLVIGPGIELKRTEYDLEGAAARIRRATYPQAGEFADRYVLHPPSEPEMLALFGRTELS